MRDHIEAELKQILQQKAAPMRMEETKQICHYIMDSQIAAEPRTNFTQFLSDVFHFESLSILGLQTITLFFLCLLMGEIADAPSYLPVFMPLFVLAVMPSIFKRRYYRMSEMEAVTRASNSQIALAKLILAGGANLVCITVLIVFEVSLQNSCAGIGRMILYCIVPYLCCATILLRIMRSKNREYLPIGIAFMLSMCALFAILARIAPQLYESSAVVGWLLLFLFFFVFFAKEIYYIISVWKVGKNYGIIY